MKRQTLQGKSRAVRIWLIRHKTKVPRRRGVPEAQPVGVKRRQVVPPGAEPHPREERRSARLQFIPDDLALTARSHFEEAVAQNKAVCLWQTERISQEVVVRSEPEIIHLCPRSLMAHQLVAGKRIPQFQSIIIA